MKKYYKSRNKNPNDNFVKLIQKAIIFSYASDIKGDLISEHKRVMTVSSRLNINPNKLDRVYILDKGIINPSQELYANDDENALGLFYLYTSFLGFAQRECKRRSPVPYVMYFGRISQNWNQI